MVTTAMIAQHFEATIKDYPKMKLREIQRIGASKMPFIGLDGCFLKGPFKSEFLTIVGRDANNQIFPIAWVVVEVEYTNSLVWFLRLLSIDDQQKGLEIAISGILPRVEHRNCTKHVFANWSGRKLWKSYECDFWQIVKCTTEREWEDLCSALEKKDKDAYDNLMKKSPKMWTRAFLGTTYKSDIVDNNLCEAFNSSIVKPRFKSIIRMLEDIKTKIMTRIVQKRKLCNRWKQNYGLLVKAKFDANKKDRVELQLIWNGENRWLQPDEYLHEYYHIDTYKKAYSFPMQPINGPHDWEKIGIKQVLPPIERKMPRRPKKNRRMAKDEPKN
ncbi:hypothetical protein J1N35_011968 [Gossypium stocksii]|uniref:MULE transposase domain-containing protein n=1 Tax=Gossypium stocksii TaxID=47602 RepID=A0A9D3W593_9ROSI|nr:hypothetical protein J1N35_011968 [Gossypium stocksii]